MPRCPSCKYRFQVMEDEDDNQHGCPSCGYGDDPDSREAKADDEDEGDEGDGFEDDEETLRDA